MLRDFKIPYIDDNHTRCCGKSNIQYEEEETLDSF
jgi:hypothetical protein